VIFSATFPGIQQKKHKHSKKSYIYKFFLKFRQKSHKHSKNPLFAAFLKIFFGISTKKTIKATHMSKTPKKSEKAEKQQENQPHKKFNTFPGKTKLSHLNQIGTN
jgi:hypothetical protein